jgi:hypothetical protein
MQNSKKWKLRRLAQAAGQRSSENFRLRNDPKGLVPHEGSTWMG